MAHRRKLIESWAAESNTLFHLFVCLDDNARAVEVGLRLQEALAKHPDCNLRIRIKTRASIANILESSQTVVPRLATFGMVEDTCCDSALRHEFNESIANECQNRLNNARNSTQHLELALLPNGAGWDWPRVRPDNWLHFSRKAIN